MIPLISNLNSNRIIPNFKQEIRLFIKVKNEAKRLPYFFQYYTEKGVDRFFLIDNDSSDETVEIAKSNQNTHVFFTKEKFSSHWSWIQFLLEKYGKGHWCLVVDADEILFYPYCEKLNIKELCNLLDKEGKTAIRNLLLDMYPNLPINLNEYHYGENPLLKNCYFDIDYYLFDRKFINKKSGLRYDFQSFYGGMRKRVFNLEACISKISLFKNINNCYLSEGMHAIENAAISELQGVTLHFKYFSEFENKVKEAVESEQFWNLSSEYKSYLKVLENIPSLNFFYEGSKKFSGTNQLMEYQLMKSNSLLENYIKSII